MAYEVAEPEDDDAARMRATTRMWLGVTVEKLLPLRQGMTRMEAAFLAAMDSEINVLKRLPSADSVQKIKTLAWKFRRFMPAPVAPKLPPHDPIVQEMDAENG